MKSGERRRAILELLTEHDHIDVKDLLEKMNSSPSTIRRDLAAMEDEGLIRKSHGKITSGSLPSFDRRGMVRDDEKDAIGRVAASLVNEGDSILIDSGTTTLAFARRLLRFRRLSVVTNSIPVAATFNDTAITTLMCGGTVRDMALVDADAVAYLSTRHVQKAFLGATGVREDEGLTVSSSLQYEVKRKMVESAKEKYALIDSSKFDCMGITVFANFAELTGIITSKPIRDEKLLRRIDKLKLKVFYADERE